MFEMLRIVKTRFYTTNSSFSFCNPDICPFARVRCRLLQPVVHDKLLWSGVVERTLLLQVCRTSVTKCRCGRMGRLVVSGVGSASSTASSAGSPESVGTSAASRVVRCIVLFSSCTLQQHAPRPASRRLA